MQQDAELRVGRQALQVKGYGATGLPHVPRPAETLNEFSQLEKSPTTPMMSLGAIDAVFAGFYRKTPSQAQPVGLASQRLYQQLCAAYLARTFEN